MVNPFLKRATEYLRDDEAFLAIVSPEPLTYFLKAYAESGCLYDRLTVIQGTPGSGKTTLARLFEYSSLTVLLKNADIESYRQIIGALVEVGAISNGRAKLVACRLAMETDYRDFWEFPYGEDLKMGLMTALIQARAVLAWLRHFAKAGYSLDQISIIPRGDATAAIAAIGGTNAEGLLRRAREVELSLYQVISALVAPQVEELGNAATDAYRPFDVIEQFVVRNDQGVAEEVSPMVILDDVHTLHPRQFELLKHWLARRELRVSRWMLTRLDILHPKAALAAWAENQDDRADLPGISPQRDVTEILLQSSGRDRRQQRLAFRRMAKDMADRYLGLMPLFGAKRLNSLASLLSTELPPFSDSKRREIQQLFRRECDDLKIQDSRARKILQIAGAYQAQNQSITPEIRVQIARILLHRHVGRVKRQASLFGPGSDPEPSSPVGIDSTLVEGASIQLMHQFGRPFYFGSDDLADAASENAEQFLRLAARLVEASAAQLIRSKPPTLTPKLQNDFLRSEAEKFIAGWNFPEAANVRRLVNRIAKGCLNITLEPNASLGIGANAYGILQNDYEKIAERFPKLARVLQFAVAYNAICIVPRYECKKQIFYLFELGGIPILHFGLTLKRGGFIEGSAKELNVWLETGE